MPSDSQGDHHADKCLESLIEVFLYIDGQIGEERARAIDEHIRHCSKCYGRVQFERMMKVFLKRKTCRERAPMDITRRVQELLD